MVKAVSGLSHIPRELTRHHRLPHTQNTIVIMLLAFPRNMQILQGLIKRWVAPNTTIYTDQWGGYGDLSTIPGKNYTHHTVNHEEYFVDPVTGAHIQEVEGANGRLREAALPLRGIKGPWTNYSDQIGGRHLYKRLVYHHPALRNQDPVRVLLSHLNAWFQKDPVPVRLTVFL